jgi:hypothetical protein
MNTRNIRNILSSALLVTAAVLVIPGAGYSQTNSAPAAKSQAAAPSAPAGKQDLWLHIRVDSPDSKDETVRVNVPLEMAEKILPTVNRDRLHSGKVQLGDVDCHGVDVHALLDAVRTSKDGEFVTVQSKDSDVRVAKQGAYLLVHAVDKNRPKKSLVEVKVPMKVVDALLSAGKDELDLVAALHALSEQGNTELVSVKDEENTVRIWLDSKNASD